MHTVTRLGFFWPSPSSLPHFPNPAIESQNGQLASRGIWVHPLFDPAYLVADVGGARKAFTSALATDPGGAAGLRINHPKTARGRATPQSRERRPPVPLPLDASLRRVSRKTLSAVVRCSE